jgi:hypothetical protein
MKLDCQFHQLIGLVESLPDELIIIIVKILSAKDCLSLIASNSSYAWLHNDKSLWKFFAVRDLHYSERVFDDLMMVDTSRSPAEIYQQISKCIHLVKMEPTIFDRPCGQPIFP